MSAAEFAALLLFAAAMCFTPGPNTTLATVIGANRGLRAALPFVSAVPFGWALLLLAAVAGLAALVTALPLLRLALKALGTAYMLWLAWQLAGRAEAAAADGRGFEVGFLRGVALQLVNLKAWLLALTVSATWVAVDGQFAARLAQVLPVMMVFAFVSNLVYALAGASLRGWLAQGRRLLWFNRVLAALLAGTALWTALL